MESEFQLALSSSCRSVKRSLENYEEEKSPLSLDSLLFHANELYRLLLISHPNDEVLERVGTSIGLLTIVEEELSDGNHVESTVSVASCPSQRGRPRFDIHKEQLEHLLYLNFSCSKITSMLGVSFRTVRRRMTEYGLSVSSLYSEMSEHELERMVNEIQSSFPNCGYCMMDGHLRQRGVRITQARIRNCMHKVDPEGVILRWRECIQRRQYRVSGPLALWHIDGNHKLIRYVQ